MFSRIKGIPILFSPVFLYSFLPGLIIATGSIAKSRVNRVTSQGANPLGEVRKNSRSIFYWTGCCLTAGSITIDAALCVPATQGTQTHSYASDGKLCVCLITQRNYYGKANSKRWILHFILKVVLSRSFLSL